MADLYDYESNNAIRLATADEEKESIQQAEEDGGAGVIMVNGVKCYVF